MIENLHISFIVLGCGMILMYFMPFSKATTFNCKQCLEEEGMELKWNADSNVPECKSCENDTYNDGRFFFCKNCSNCTNSTVLHKCTLKQDTICEGDTLDKDKEDDKPDDLSDPCTYFNNKEDLKRFITTRCQIQRKTIKESGHLNKEDSTTENGHLNKENSTTENGHLNKEDSTTENGHLNKEDSTTENGHPKKEETTIGTYILVIVCIILAIALIILIIILYLYKERLFKCTTLNTRNLQERETSIEMGKLLSPNRNKNDSNMIDNQPSGKYGDEDGGYSTDQN